MTNEIEFIPTVNTEYGIELAKGKEKEDIMKAFAERNASIADGTWRDGWLEFCESVKEYYVRDISGDSSLSEEERGDTIFAHYLDCEAHADVLRELYKTANHRNEK